MAAKKHLPTAVAQLVNHLKQATMTDLVERKTEDVL
jgi:hypothetical protein